MQIVLLNSEEATESFRNDFAPTIAKQWKCKKSDIQLKVLIRAEQHDLLQNI